MAFGSLCSTKFTPLDADKMTADSDINIHLKLGREVTLDKNGWIVDIWDPVTKKLYNAKGVEIGTRDKTFTLPEASEVRTTENKTFLPEDKDKFPEGGDLWHALNAGRQVTVDANGFIIDVWDSTSKKTYDGLGKEIGTRPIAHGEILEREYRNPMGTTFKPEDKSKFDETEDAWIALNEGYQVTVDERYNILDIWDPESGNLFDATGERIGNRVDPYPSDNNIEDTKRKFKLLAKEIILLRRDLRTKIGTEKVTLEGIIKVKQREFGQLVYLFGRLTKRKRTRDKKYDRGRSKSTTPQIPSK